MNKAKKSNKGNHASTLFTVGSVADIPKLYLNYSA